MVFPFDPSQFDPSKMDPKLMMQLSQLIQELPPAQLNRLQTLMHNMMAGHDVKKDLEDFEKGLPPGFRERMASLFTQQMMPNAGLSPNPAPRKGAHLQSVSPVEPATSSEEMNLKEARLTILRAVSDGHMSPEEAEKLLFSADQ